MMTQDNKSFAEVVESSLTGFVAQSWEWDYAPSFGSLVMIHEDAHILFALVHQVNTGSIDAVRTPFAYRKTQEELKREQPHIFEFLKTTFSCVTVGYRQGPSVMYMMAPQPPKIHAFVAPVTPELAKQFFSSHDYLYVIFGMQGQIAHVDELLLALVTQGMQHGYIDERGLRVFMEAYVLLTGNEYRRTKLFAQRVQHVLGA